MKYRIVYPPNPTGVVRAGLAGIILVLGLGLVWSGEMPSDTPLKNKPAAISELAPENIIKLQFVISRLRDLEFKNSVAIDSKNKDALKRKMMDDYEKNAVPEETAKVNRALVKFGLIPPGLNLDKFMTDLYTEQIAGYYDAETKELYTISGQTPESQPAQKEVFGVPWERLTVVHEMTHALQDQNFDLLTLPMDSEDNDDIATAVKSLVEGEATFVMYDYLFRQGGLNMVILPDMSDTEESPQGTNQSLIDQAPLYIREGLTFPYVKGLEFIKFIKSREGWPAINKMYADLPQSTEQIIHPEKYMPETRDYPTEVKLADVSKLLPPDKWQLLLQNIMGELNVDILLREFMPTLKTDLISAGWDGDEFAVWENKDTNPLTGGLTSQIVLVWFTTWDTTKDAREFFNAYNKLVARKYQMPTVLKKESAYRLWETKPEQADLVLLERRDQDVLIIEGLTKELLDPLTQAIWKDTTKTELRVIKRIDPEQMKKEREQKKKEQEEKKK